MKTAIGNTLIIDRNFRFEPADNILMSGKYLGKPVNQSPIKRLKTYLIGEWEHIAIFLDYSEHGLPLKIESDGTEGIATHALFEDEGRYIRVLRFKDKARAKEAASRANDLAGSPVDWYAFFGIVDFVIPRLICYRLFGRRFSFTWKSPHFICSVLANKIDGQIIPADRQPPLPNDFNDVSDFTVAAEGYLQLREDILKAVPQAPAWEEKVKTDFNPSLA